MSGARVLERVARNSFECTQLCQPPTRLLVGPRDPACFQTRRETTLWTADQRTTPVPFGSGGSSLTGQTLGRGLVVDARSGFHSIADIRLDSTTRQAGVSRAQLEGNLPRARKKVDPVPPALIASTRGSTVSKGWSGTTSGVEVGVYGEIIGAPIVTADSQTLGTAGLNALNQCRRHKSTLRHLIDEKKIRGRADEDSLARRKPLPIGINTRGCSLKAFVDCVNTIGIATLSIVSSDGTCDFLGVNTRGLPLLKKLKSFSMAFFADSDIANDSQMEISAHAHDRYAVELRVSTSLAALDCEGLLPRKLRAHITEASAKALMEFESDDP